MRLYFICCHLSAKSEDFFGIWQVSILRVVFYSQIERALNLNNYCQMSVWRSFREIELYVAKYEKKLLLFERLRTFCMFSDKTKQKIQSLQSLGSFYRLDLTNWWYNQLRLLFAIGLWSVLLPWRGDCHSEETLSKRIVTRERCSVFSSRYERVTKKKMLSTHEESNLRPSESALRCIVIVTVKIINYFLVVILNTKKIIFYIFHEHWVRISSLETDRILYFFIH